MIEAICLTCGQARLASEHPDARRPIDAAQKYIKQRCNRRGACEMRYRRNGQLVRIGRPPLGLFLRKDATAEHRIGVSTQLARALGSHARFRRTPAGESIIERARKGETGARAIICNVERGNYCLSHVEVAPMLKPKRRYYLEPVADGVFRLARIEADAGASA